MKCYPNVKDIWTHGFTCLFAILFLLFCLTSIAQETNSRATGKVLSDHNEIIAGASVLVIHEPTQNKYSTKTRNDGYFDFFNLKPGGPYSVIISAVGYETLKKENLFVYFTTRYFNSDHSEITEFLLQYKIVTLSGVVANTRSAEKTKPGTVTTITKEALHSLPSINRNFQDYIRLVPQAKVNGDGVMSLAGQNNRFNAFFIDGANNTDIKGLSVNGMNGGQTGSPPISTEALEEISIMLAPYHVQYGNFTGGSINAITRSGSNKNKFSAWYYFRNENMAGRSPDPVLKPDSSGYHHPLLSNFFNQTFGAWNSGAVIKDKLFYFFLVEHQSESRPQPFNFSAYKGNSSLQQIQSLRDFIQESYRYDAGSFLESKDDLKATRISLKMDLNASLNNKLTLSYRYNNAERVTAPRPSSITAISFSNSGVKLPATTHSLALEWKHFFEIPVTNRVLATFTRQVDYRKWLGQPFPNVTILDGNGTLNFGSEPGSGMNDFKATDFSLLDVFTYVKKKHVYTAGAEINFSHIHQRTIPAFFGAYQYRNLNEFTGFSAPNRLQRNFYLTENNFPVFQTLRNSVFVNDEIKLSEYFTVNGGVRLDVNAILPDPVKDPFFNDSAIHIISRYYDLERAKSGQAMKAHWNLSPRIGFNYNLDKYRLRFKGGAGLFLGHIVNFWLFDIFNGHTGTIDVIPQQFIPDPYQQPTPQSLNMDPSNLKGALILISKNFKYPSVFRTSLTAEKMLKNGWSFVLEGIITRNIQEMAFRNVNILPPTGISEDPDSRNVYSNDPVPTKIPLKSNGTNPYAQVMLLTNNHKKKGNAYSLSFVVSKQFTNFSFHVNYTYGRSTVLSEITGAQTPVFSQWRNIETVNGRNFVSLSTSDNDLKHRVSAWFSSKFQFAKQKTATIISLFYNGQSGAPYSYVYTNSMINDNGRRNENFDLIYIPTLADLSHMNFAAITDNVTGQVLYTPQQQKDALNTFISNDAYLRKHRGEFSKRNGARLPFSHTVDIRLQQDVTLSFSGKKFSITVIYDIFNFTNLLKRNWGRSWFLLNDSYPLITFVGFPNSPILAPQYQFRPFNGNPYSVQTSTIPGNSARWISQLGLKINLN